VEITVVWSDQFTATLRHDAPPAQSKDFDSIFAYCERLAAQIVALPQLLAEVEGLRAFKAAVDAALNSGDGSYRP
jgi:hypothetical protein